LAKPQQRTAPPRRLGRVGLRGFRLILLLGRNGRRGGFMSPSLWTHLVARVRHLAVLVLAVTSAVTVTVLPASAGTATQPTAATGVSQRAGVNVADRLGDGRPDIVRMTVRRSRTAFAVVHVRVRDVGTGAGFPSMLLYVDPFGDRRRPSYGIWLPIEGASEYNVARTRGWRFQPRRSAFCGESVRLFEPSRTVRHVRFRLPRACFGGASARFAVKTYRQTFRGQIIGRPDWAPRARTLSRIFRF
jgi:hypothetical protein